MSDAGAWEQPRRSAARLAAVQALYEMDLVGAEADAVLDDFLRLRWQPQTAAEPSDSGAATAGDEARIDGAEMVEPDGAWLGDLVRGTAARRDELDKNIGDALTGALTPDRLETLLRVILRVGAYELANKPEVPTAAVINEYLEVTHAFFDDREARLVNGVLDRVAKALRPGER